jgi:hypothetical protein
MPRSVRAGRYSGQGSGSSGAKVGALTTQ